MNPWGLLPIPGALAFIWVALAAASGRGEPRGRTSLFGAGLAGAGLLVALGWILSDPSPSHLSSAIALANGGLLLALPTWIALSIRFGTAAGQSGGWSLLVPAACLVDVALVLAGAIDSDATRVELTRTHAPLLLQGSAARAVAGAFLLVGAVGVLRTQSLWEVARLEQHEELRRGYAGLILSFLGLFLFAAQTLLYGAVSLRILALVSLLFVPTFAVLLPLLRPKPAPARALSSEARPVVSSAVLMGLGGFLIMLAAVGEFMAHFAPAGRVLWFQWGGSILVGAYGALWLIPGLRRRFRRWLQVPELGRTYDWEAMPLLEHARPTGDGPALLLLSALFEEPQGRPAVALWLRAADGTLAPWASSTSTLPRVRPDNPLLRVLRLEGSVLDLSRPPHRLALVPSYVENLELIEQNGFRLFLALRAGRDEFGLLAIAPRDPARSAEDALLLDLYRGEIAVLTWGAVAAWSASPTGEEQAFLYARAAELVREIAERVTQRTVAPRFGARLAAAAEEVAHQLTTRATPRARPSGGSEPRAGSPRGSIPDEVRA